MRAIPAWALLCLVASGALAQGTIALTSTSVSGVLADALAPGPDGSLWSVNQTANTISHVTFPDLHVSTFNVPTADAGLTGITAGPDGNMWFTESTARKIGRVTSSGTISEFPIPTNAAPPQRILPGPNGVLWSFNACFFSGCSRFIVTTTAGASTELLLKVPGTASFAPSNCTLGSDGNVWCIGNETIPSPFSSHFTAARIDPSGGYTAFVPSTGAQGSAMVTAPDGNVWYAWELAGTSTGVARVSPSGVITEYIVPTGKPQSWIFGLAVGADGNLYFADRQTSILYELVLSTATDSGTATLNSGTIQIDIPEDIVSVSNQRATAEIRPQGVPEPTCPAVAFIARSGGSGTGRIEWETTDAPTTCTDLLAGAANQRYGDEDMPGKTKVGILCADLLESKNDATRVVLRFSSKDATIDAIKDGNWDHCDLGTSSFQCFAAAIPKGDSRTAYIFGNFGSSKALVTCSSEVPEMEPNDNQAIVTFGETVSVSHLVATITRRHS